MNHILKDIDVHQTGTQFVFDPYNNQNKELTREDLNHLFQTYGLSGVSIHNFDLYQHAFIHSSYRVRPNLPIWKQSGRVYCKPRPPDCMELVTYDNERMEFLGDGILESVVKFYLYRRFPIAEPEFLNTSKISLVKNTSIGNLVLEMGMHQWYILSKQAEKDGIRTDPRTLGCLFESFVGAIFLDFEHEQKGFCMAQRFIEAVFDMHGAWLAKIADVNYKNKIQIWVQKEFKVVPTYRIMEDYNRADGYHMGLYICIRCPEEIPFRTLRKHSISNFQSLNDIHFYLKRNSYVCILVTSCIHKSKPDAEQGVANKAYQILSGMPRART
jgi:dsRNA-specific ribonuclease